MSFRFSPIALPLLLSLASIARGVDAEGVTEDKKSRSLKPADRKADTTPADSAAAAQKGFRRAKIPAGFKADLWASEPLLANPVAFSFDGKGRMFIAETHRYRTSVLDIRHYMFMLEDDLANRNQADWERSIKKNFPNDWQELGKETEVVRLVEDTDGDGKADKSGVYADGFNSILDGIASGVLARPDGVWVTNIPGLYKLTGQGADGKAEKKEEVFRGFGVRFSYTGHDLHGLIKGPDGRLYFSIGDRGASVKTKEGGTINVPDEGAIFRCEEDGSHLELVMRGLRNPQELAFDDYGNLFTCDNDSDQGDRERLVYVVEGGDAGWRVGYQHCPQPAERNPWLAEHMWEPRDPAKNQPASILSPVANLPDGPGGLVHYPGTGLPEKYNGCFFLACYKGSSLTSQVAVFKPVPEGAGFKLEMLETFIPGCQATDVDFGPDSRMYVSFWDEGWERTAQGRIMKVEHEEARKADPEKELDLVQTFLGEGFKEHNLASLARLLRFKDQRIRLEGQWELAAREEGGRVLTDIAGKCEQLAVIHAIWGLGQRARRSVNGWKALASFCWAGNPFMDPPEDPEIRSQIIRTVCDAFERQSKPVQDESRGSVQALCGVGLLDKSARVRFFAAQGLGKCGEAKAVQPLLDLARREQDKSQEMRHVISHALFQLAQRDQKTWETVRAAAGDGDASVRRVVLLASARLAAKAQTMTNGEPWFQDAATVVARFLAATESSLSREAAWLITDRGLTAALPALASGPMLASDKMTVLRRLNANFRQGKQANVDMLLEFACGAVNDLNLRSEALRLAGTWHLPLGPQDGFIRMARQRDQVTGLQAPEMQGEAGGIQRGRASTFDVAESMSARIFDLLNGPEPVVSSTLDAIAELTGKVPELSGVRLLSNYIAIFVTADPNPRWFSKPAAPALRVKGVKVLAKMDTGDYDLFGKLAQDSISTVRIAAAGYLATLAPEDAAKALESALAQGTAEDARAAFVELASLTGADADRILAEQLSALTAGKVPALARLELLEAAAKHEAPAVKEALSKYEASLPKDDVVAKFAVCLEGGDAAAGRKLYSEHPVAACRRCHMINKSGGEAGPPLDGIGTRKDRHYLLESIIAPNAQIAETFRMVVCNMKDGTVKTGVLREEKPESITIQTPGEEPETLKTADIATRDAVPSGMMPGLDQLLSKRELRDLVEYLASLRETPAPAAH